MRHDNGDGATFAWMAVELKFATDGQHALLHAQQAKTMGLAYLVGVKALPIILDRDLDIAGAEVQIDPCMLGFGVSGNVGQGLLNHAEHRSGGAFLQ